jgi:uncharacterized delta-60 repeat protein
MKTFLSIILLTVLTTKVFSQSISLDNTFANNGILLLPSANTSEIDVLDIDQNGNIYTAGVTSQGIGTGIYKMTVSKTNQNGVLDNQFGINGVCTISFGNSVYPHGIKVSDNSKILICGKADAADTIPSFGFLVRLNTDGSIDSSFAINGLYKLVGLGSHFTSINILNDNSIILSGNTDFHAVLVKLDENGIPDLQFGLNSVLTLSSINFNLILFKSQVTANDEIISVGYENTESTNTKIAYCKTDSTGNFVATFGIDGKVIIDLYNKTPNVAEGLTLIKKGINNHYYLGGYSLSSILIRIKEDGSLDSTFATFGVLTHSFPFRDFDIQDNGKILIAGDKQISDFNYGYSIIRFDENGSIDTTFNNGASFDIDFSVQNDYLSCVKYIRPNGFIIGGESHDNNIAKSTLIKLKLDNTENIKDKDNLSDFSIYPNPFTDQLNISYVQPIKSIEMYSINGIKLLSANEIHSRDFILRTANIEPGMYFIKIKIDNAVYIRKLVKH